MDDLRPDAARDPVWSYVAHTPHGDITAENVTLDQVVRIADAVDRSFEESGDHG